jgi:hypothetical protein
MAGHLLVRVRTWPASMKNSSLCSLPSMLEPVKPLPISTPYNKITIRETLRYCQT